jgi:hypothetical protein
MGCAAKIAEEIQELDKEDTVGIARRMHQVRC